MCSMFMPQCTLGGLEQRLHIRVGRNQTHTIVAALSLRSLWAAAGDTGLHRVGSPGRTDLRLVQQS